MPRPADHDQRRSQVARAFQRLLATEGYAGVPLSKVAVEAGVSVGLIQHYFPDKDALLRFAYDDAVGRTAERVQARVRDGGAAGLPTAEVLLESLVELLPLDPVREVEYRVRQGLFAQALHRPDLYAIARRSGRDVLSQVAAVVAHGVARGEVAPDIDPTIAARTILATVQGLADQVALSGADAFPVRDVLRPVLGLAFRPPAPTDQSDNMIVLHRMP